MERKEFANQFSQRLIHIMRMEGHTTNRSKDKVDILRLAKSADCSYQMARRYTLGQAMPEFYVVQKIAAWLNTSPSHLLFGNEEFIIKKSNAINSITIDIDLLKYILIQATTLFRASHNTTHVINFIVSTAYDASHIDADTHTLFKIIDMMIASTTALTKDGLQQECELQKNAHGLNNVT